MKRPRPLIIALLAILAPLTFAQTQHIGSLSVGNGDLTHYPNAYSMYLDAEKILSIQSPIPATEACVFRVRGFSEGGLKMVDFMVAWGPVPNSISLVDSGNDGYKKFIGNDNAGNLAIGMDSSEEIGAVALSIDAWVNQNPNNSYHSNWLPFDTFPMEYTYLETTGSFGVNTTASKEYSYAFGDSTTASGDYSFAVGKDTEASGLHAFASGLASKARGMYSRASGKQSIASGSFSFASGQKAIANNAYAFSHGFKSLARGHYSTALGRESRALSSYSTAIGYFNTSSGYAAVSFGRNNKALGSCSTVFGVNSIADGNYSNALGRYARAYGAKSTAIGNLVHIDANATGAFGYADSLNEWLKIETPNSFKVRATGGVDFETRGVGMKIGLIDKVCEGVMG